MRASKLVPLAFVYLCGFNPAHVANVPPFLNLHGLRCASSGSHTIHWPALCVPLQAADSNSPHKIGVWGGVGLESPLTVKLDDDRTPRNARMIGGGGRVWGAARGEDGHGVRPATL